MKGRSPFRILNGLLHGWSVKGFGALSIVSAALTGCSSVQQDYGPSSSVDVAHIPDAQPQYEVRTQAGNKSPYTVLGETYRVMEDDTGFTEQGIGSWYGYKFHGRRTSNGEIYDMYGMTAAHKTLPLPAYVRVTNLDNGRSVVVRVNDRGPFHEGRVIDLSYAAAAKLDYVNKGTARVKVEALAMTGEGASSPSKVAIDGSVYQLPDNTYLQAGAFGAEESARLLVRRLSEETELPVFVDDKGDRLYRVRIGPIADNRDLLHVKQQIEQKKLATPHVVYE